MALPRVFLAVFALAISGCATAPSIVSDRLFFGTDIPGGGKVSQAQWNAFVAEVVEPRFPQGFAVWRGAGFWKGDDGVSGTEDICVVEIFHAPNPADEAKLDEIARTYRQRFNQDAVILNRTPIRQKFWKR